MPTTYITISQWTNNILSKQIDAQIAEYNNFTTLLQYSSKKLKPRVKNMRKWWKLPSLAILTPPSSSTEATGCLHFLLSGLSQERAAEEEEKGRQKVKLFRPFVRRESEVLEKRRVWAKEKAVAILVISLGLEEFGVARLLSLVLSMIWGFPFSEVFFVFSLFC